MNTDSRTNALDYIPVYAGDLPRVSIALRVRSRLRSFRRWLAPIDDFNWNDYPEHYRAENAFNRRYFTDDLRDVSFLFAHGKLFLLADCKPLNLTHRCLLEAICNLPRFESVAEIGVGGGRYLVNLRAILGDRIRLSGYDLSERQLAFFRELFPDVFAGISTAVMDLTLSSIPAAARPDVVYASTVLMHIQRSDAYRNALANLLDSARAFVVIMDNWGSHDYFADLTSHVRRDATKRLYLYDSGANVAVVVALAGRSLGPPYVPLVDEAQLQRYRSLTEEKSA